LGRRPGDSALADRIVWLRLLLLLSEHGLLRGEHRLLGQLSLLGLLHGGSVELRGQRLGQLHGQRSPHRQGGFAAPDDGIRHRFPGFGG
jgi:hypothetical protein